MMGAKPKENTFSRAKLELILIIGSEKWKTSTTKNTNLGRAGVIEQLKWCFSWKESM